MVFCSLNCNFAAGFKKRKDKSMETITIKYNPANALAMSAIELLRRIKGITIVPQQKSYKPNAETVAAIKELRSGKCKRYKSADEMFNDI